MAHSIALFSLRMESLFKTLHGTQCSHITASIQNARAARTRFLSWEGRSEKPSDWLRVSLSWFPYTLGNPSTKTTESYGSKRETCNCSGAITDLIAVLP